MILQMHLNGGKKDLFFYFVKLHDEESEEMSQFSLDLYGL